MQFASSGVLFRIVFCCLGLFLFACSNPTHYDYFIDYVPDTGTPPDNSIALMRADSPDEILEVAVDVYNLELGTVSAAYFDLVFRSEVMDFIGYERGDFFEKSSPDVMYQAAVDTGDPDRLVVGVSLEGLAEPVLGNGVIIYLKFKPNHLGTCPFFFENMGLRNNATPGGSPVTGVPWYAGYAKVTS